MDEYSWAEPTLGKTDAVRQHYVPRMLLGNFAIASAISVYDIETGRTFLASTNNVGVQSAFYDVLEGPELLSAETWLAEVEGAAASIIRSIIGDPDAILNLSPDEQEALARFIAAQLFRTPKMREQEAGWRQQLVDHLKKAGRRLLEKEEGPEGATVIWDACEDKPDEFFLNEETPPQPARPTAARLARATGFVNIPIGDAMARGIA